MACCGPHAWRVSLALFSVIGFVLSVIAAFSCEFLNKVEDVYSPFSSYWMGKTWHGLGFMGKSKYGYGGDSSFCSEWTQFEKDNLWDASWVAGWSFALIAFSLGVLALIASFLFCCMDDINKIYCCLICFYLFTAVCQGLSFIALSSNLIDAIEELQGFDYNFGVGAGCSAAAAIVWALCALFAGKSIDRDQKEHDDGEGQSVVESNVVASKVAEEPVVTTTVTQMEDGTRVTETVTTFPDGSREISTTTENPV